MRFIKIIFRIRDKNREERGETLCRLFRELELPLESLTIYYTVTLDALHEILQMHRATLRTTQLFGRPSEPQEDAENLDFLDFEDMEEGILHWMETLRLCQRMDYFITVAVHMTLCFVLLFVFDVR